MSGQPFYIPFLADCYVLYISLMDRYHKTMLVLSLNTCKNLYRLLAKIRVFNSSSIQVLYIKYIELTYILCGFSRFGVYGMARRRRDRLEIVADILTEALNGANKTRIMYRANLNFVRFKKYFSVLLDRGLIVGVNNPDGGRVVYKTTEKGRALLGALRKAERFISL